MNRWAFCCSCVVTLLFVAGCADSRPKPPPAAKVAGTVTLDGKPMEGGEVRFTAPGQIPKVLPVQAGAFSGEVLVGQNQVEVIWNKEGPPHPMDPNARIMVNAVSPQFMGPNSPLKAEVAAGGNTDLKFEVTSAK